MRLRNIGAVNDMAQCGRRAGLETASAFGPAPSIASGVTVVVIPLDMVGKTCPSRPRSHILEMPRRSALECSPRQRARLTNAAPLPVSIEYLIEALPIRMRRDTQPPQC